MIDTAAKLKTVLAEIEKDPDGVASRLIDRVLRASLPELFDVRPSELRREDPEVAILQRTCRDQSARIETLRLMCHKAAEWCPSCGGPRSAAEYVRSVVSGAEHVSVCPTCQPLRDA